MGERIDDRYDLSDKGETKKSYTTKLITAV